MEKRTSTLCGFYKTRSLPFSPSATLPPPAETRLQTPSPSAGAVTAPGLKRLRAWLRRWIVPAALALAPGLAAAETMTFLMQAFPPMIQNDNGVARGPMPEMMHKFCAAMNVRCILAFKPWRRALQAGELGEVDGLLGLVRLPEREDKFYLSPPLIQGSYAVFARRREAARYRSTADLAGHTIGVYVPSGTELVAQRAAKAAQPPAVLIREISNETALKKLRGGRYGEHGVAIVNRDLGNATLELLGIQDVVPTIDLEKAEYVLGLSKQKFTPEQADKMYAILQQLIRSGALKGIAESYGMKAAF